MLETDQVMNRSELDVQGGSDSSLLELLAPVGLGRLHGSDWALEWMWLHRSDRSSGLGESREVADAADGRLGCDSGRHFDGWLKWW